MMAREDLISFLIRSVAEVAGVEAREISPDMKLRTEGVVDSLQFVDLMVLVEQETGLFVDDDTVLDGIDSIEEAADALIASRSHPGPP